MQIHTSTQNNYVSLAKEFQQNISKQRLKNGVIDQGKYRKRFSERKWTDREYHVQYNDDFSHKDGKIYCNTKQLPALPFCGPHSKPRGSKGLSKHYHFSIDTKIGNGVCTILRIPCACVACTTMIDKPWMYGIPLKK